MVFYLVAAADLTTRSRSRNLYGDDSESVGRPPSCRVACLVVFEEKKFFWGGERWREILALVECEGTPHPVDAGCWEAVVTTKKASRPPFSPALSATGPKSQPSSVKIKLWPTLLPPPCLANNLGSPSKKKSVSHPPPVG